MKENEGQVALEYIIVITFLLTAAIILFIYVSNTTQEIIQTNKVINAVNRLASTNLHNSLWV